MHRSTLVRASGLFVSLFCLLLPGVLPAQSITAGSFPSSVAGAGGTGTTGYPYAVFVRIQGWTAGAGAQAYVKIYNSTNNEYMWSSTGAWSNTTAYNAANQPVVTIDGAGNWSGWIYAKHNDALGAVSSLRTAKVGATSTNLTGALPSFSILTMTSPGTGGWLVRSSSPAVNKPVAAFAGGKVVGSYRTEDNGIAEGYGYAPGGFRVAVPAGVVDSVVTYNDDGSRDQAFDGRLLSSGVYFYRLQAGSFSAVKRMMIVK